MLELTPGQQSWAFGFCPLGFSICLILSIFLSLSSLLLKSAVKKKKKVLRPFIPSTGDSRLVFITPFSPHVHRHHCLSPLPYVCFTFPASFLHQTHDCSLFTSGFICFTQLFPDCFHRLFLSSPFLFLPAAASLSSYSFGQLSPLIALHLEHFQCCFWPGGTVRESCAGLAIKGTLCWFYMFKSYQLGLLFSL